METDDRSGGMPRPPRDGDAEPPARFGPLEARVLERLWRKPSPHSVRDLCAWFPATPYTTLMTTLDRLYKKGLLVRSRRGRAFLYAPRYTRDGLRDQIARRDIDRLLGPVEEPEALRPILSTFVQEVGRRDDGLLDALEEMIRARRRGERR